MRTMAFDVASGVFVSVHIAGPPSDADWDAATQRMAKRDFRVKLVWTAGGSPSAAQRMRTRQALGDETEPLALLTDSLAARTVLGVMSLFFKNMRAFALRDEQAAMDYLQVPAADRDVVAGLLARLKAELGITRAAA